MVKRAMVGSTLNDGGVGPDEAKALAMPPAHNLDGDEARAELNKLLSWFYAERDRQAENRLQMAIDADFYDNIQWRDEDAAILRERGQMPLVYNEIAPMLDWVIGTERRTRVDAKVLPRTEDDVDMADVKTKVMKYVSDVNRTRFVRSAAFADAVKSGVGWIDNGARDDPSKDVLYCKHESWRRVLHDSLGGLDLELDEARYIFRWRHVDEDVAVMMFPDRAEAIRRSAEADAYWREFGDDDELDSGFGGPNDAYGRRAGRSMLAPTGADANQPRRQVKLIECQYRKPARVRVVEDGQFAGQVLNEVDRVMVDAVSKEGASIIDRVMMRVHVAIFTESAMLSMGQSIYRHNRFSLTPVWCYRRGRDNQPYGMARRVRDIQEDINKRASKAQFLLNSNQIIADEGAVDDWDVARDEASRPDGVIVKKQGKEFRIDRNMGEVTGQIQLMTLGAQSIQKIGGVSDENLGRQTNAVSGEAIKARQLQGSVVTTEPFDNLRLAVQVSGEKELSLTEQFYTGEKVIRLTGAKGALEWIKINQIEVGTDGETRVLNDITASMADFVVSEADYAGTLRQVMFDSINMLAQKVPPEVGLKLMTTAMEFSDLPNKDEIAQAFRKVTGEPDPDREPTPEEQQQLQEQQQQQAEALEMQRQDAQLALQERQAKVREINAKAAEIEARIAAGAEPDVAAEVRQQIDAARAAAADEIDRLSEQLAKATAESAALRAKADSTIEAARIDAAARVQAEEIKAGSDRRFRAIDEKLNALAKPAVSPDSGAAPVAPAGPAGALPDVPSMAPSGLPTTTEDRA